LKTTELLPCLREIIDGDIDPAILRDPPDAIKLRQVFELVLQRVLFVEPEELFTPLPEALTALDAPTLHTQSIVELHFYRSWLLLLQKVGVADFSYRDLLAPTLPRTKIVLSAVVNFIRFSEHRYQQYASWQDVLNVLLFDKERADVEVADLNEAYNRLKLEVATEEEEKQRLLQEHEALKQKVAQLNQNQAKLTMEHEEQKKRKQELDSEINKLDSQIEEREMELGKVKPQIVQSPEKLKHSVVDLSTNLENLRIGISAEERKMAALESRLKSIKKIKIDIEKCITLLRDGEKHRARKQETKTKLSEQENQMVTLSHSKRDLFLREQQLLGQIKVMEESLRINTEFYQPRILESQKKLLSVQNERSQLHQEQVAVTSTLKEQDLLVRDILIRKETLQRVFITQIEKMEHMENEMTRLLTMYQERVKAITS